MTKLQYTFKTDTLFKILFTKYPELREAERMRSKARHDEAQALQNARREATAIADTRWQSVIADKDAENEELRKQLAELRAQHGE